ncbi:unnamed protein product [Blepharisma stoltei]|uniref:LNR domain-containing protein n=1 Tax=Blepharisma stoltei TaxID=1481888 RepID=A0AAU9ID86_9CILI|nr:unnamed protein product [Blepharisma stoltei]
MREEMILIFSLKIILGLSIYSLSCNENWCPSNWRGDGSCDLECMAPYCNLDSSTPYSSPLSFKNSDCYENCIYSRGCPEELLGNSVCNSECNNLECGFDLGDCGYCAQGCYDYMLGSHCYKECNNSTCYYGAGICKECNTGCSSDMLGNNKCDPACRTASCNYDFGDCSTSDCSDGCFLWMIEDGICQSECHNQNCNWDGTDCDCSPGCTEDLLKNTVCDSLCNNSACLFDNMLCGYCASLCYKNMIGNGICNQECYNKACSWDVKDCQCAETCYHTEWGKCSEGCMVPECSYDQCSSDPSKRCTNKEEILLYAHLRLINNDLKTVPSLNHCKEKTKCNTTSLLDSSACMAECDNEYCAYSWINCDPERSYQCSDSNCLKCYNKDPGGCFQCDYSKTHQFFGYCLESCPSGFTSLNLFDELDMCIPAEDKSNMGSPAEYYVTSIQTDDPIGGLGTYESPFQSLALALATINTKDSIVYLLNDGVHYLTQLNQSYPIYVTTEDPTKPFNSQLQREILTITTLNDDYVYLKPKIDWSILTIAMNNTNYLDISNVIFDGNEWVHGNNGCLDNACSYCPTVTLQYDGTYKDDRNSPISDFTNSTYCSDFHSWNLFEILPGTQLFLENVAFINWRLEEASLIFNVGGDLIFSNVTFDNIRTAPNQESSVIIYRNCGNKYYDCGDLVIEGGKVSRLNNGFEYSKDLIFRGFLLAYKIGNIELHDIEFTENAVYAPETNVSVSSLIYLEIFRRIDIHNCNFTYNYVKDGLIYAMPTNLLLKSDVNSENEIEDYLINHISITNSIFKNNYAVSAGILWVSYQIELQNIYFGSVDIENNAVESGPIIFIYNAIVRDSYIHGVTSIITTSKGKRLSAYQRYRTFHWAYVNFINNFSGGSGMFEITKLVNMRFENVTMNSNGSSDLKNEDINTILFSYWLNDSSIYLKQYIPASTFDCTSLAYLDTATNISIINSHLENNYCKDSLPTICIYSTNIIFINATVFDGNYGASTVYPTILLIDGGNETSIDYSDFMNNRNNELELGYGSIYIKGVNHSVSMFKTNFENNYAVNGAVVFSGRTIKICQCDFTSNQSPTDGAGIYISHAFHGTMNISISECTFTQNEANLGSGGAIFLKNTGVSSNLISFSLAESNFTKNNANYGSGLYISSDVKLYGYAKVVQCEFIENYVHNSGVVAVLFRAGVLEMSQCTFSLNVGRLGSAIYAEHADDSVLTASKVLIDSSNFKENTGKAVIFLSNSDVFSYIKTSYCNFTSNSGVAIHLDYDQWFDQNSTFKLNVGIEGGGLKMLDGSSASCENTSFIENVSGGNGGGVSLGSKSQFSCASCYFINNQANFSGGAIYNEQSSVLNISYTVFHKNQSGDQGSAVYLLGSTSPTSNISHCGFIENYSSNQAAVALLDSSISIGFSAFSRNLANSITPGILLTLSNATIHSSTFFNQTGQQGSFIYATTQSLADIYNSTFENGTSTSSAGAIFSISSTVLINKSKFENNAASGGGGGVILSYSSSVLHVNDSSFVNSYCTDRGGIITAYEGDLTLQNTSCENYKDGAIAADKMHSVYLKNSKFYKGVGTLGGALFCTSCNIIEISDSEFSENHAYTGGALYLYTTGDNKISKPYIISKSIFTENKSALGGGIYTDNISLNVSSSAFSQNRAESDTSVTSSIPTLGNGGAINLACSDLASCAFNITDCNFTENFATSNGGAINWEDCMPFVEGNDFSNNEAQYAPEISSYAVQLTALDKWGNATDSNRVLSDIVLKDVASGQIVVQSLILALVDYFKNTITTDNISTAELSTEKSVTTALSGTTKVTASKGVFYFSEFIISAEPGSEVSIKVATNGIDESNSKKLSPDIEFITSLEINVALRECVIGEATVGVTCKVCEANYYSLNPNNTQCLPCPSSAICYGNYTMVPTSGHWRSNNMSIKFWECPLSSACIGSPSPPNVSLTGLCDTGYEGNMCQGCSEGYSRVGKNSCGKCPDDVANSFRVIGMFILMVIVAGIMVRTTQKSAYVPKSMQSIYIKIFVNYLQLVMLMSTFDLSWPSTVLEIFAVQNNAGSISDQIFSFDCFLDSGNGQNDIYFKKLVIMAAVPIFIGFCSLLFWSLIALHRHDRSSFKNNLVSTIVILLFLFHPNLVKTMFSVFSCREIDSGEYWLVDNLNIRCWDERHIFYSILVAIPAIIIWGIGIPTVSLFFLYKNRKHLDSINVRLRFGFLFNGYKSRSYFWEFIILYRKILIVCCSVFLANVSTNVQALTVMGLILFCIYIHNKSKPYNGEILNKMEARSLLVAGITIYCGLYYLTNDLDSPSKLFFFFIILGANIYFLYYWLNKMFGVGLEVLSQVIPYFKRKCSKKVMDGFDDGLFGESELKHVRIREGEKIFSIVPGEAMLPSHAVEPELVDLLNMNIKELFLQKAKENIEKSNVRKISFYSDEMQQNTGNISESDTFTR